MTGGSSRPASRPLHPGSWWIWAIGCAVVSSRITNPILLGLTIAIIVVVVIWKRSSAPWAAAFRLYVWLACVVVLIRVGFRIVFSAAGQTVLIPLPTLRLPGVLSSVVLFGPVSVEALLSAGAAAMQLAAMIIAVGAANSLADPKRLLAGVPRALYEWGTVVVIALSVFPQLAESVVRVRRARQLRSAGAKDTHLIKHVAMPVLADALDRSLILAGAMDSRGYGRTGSLAPGPRRVASLMILVATMAICIGAYGLLDTGSTPTWMGLPMVVLGMVTAVIGLRLAGRRVIRTRYRPDTMTARSWVLIASGLVAAVGAFLVSSLQPTVAYPPMVPLAWPQVSLAGLITVLVLAVPIVAAPDPPGEQRSRGRGEQGEAIIPPVASESLVERYRIMSRGGRG